MIRVTIDLVSAVDPSRSRCLGVAEISNDGEGDVERGNYLVRLYKWTTERRIWRIGRVKRFPRKAFGPWDLLFLGLFAALGQKRLKRMPRDVEAVEGS